MFIEVFEACKPPLFSILQPSTLPILIQLMDTASSDLSSGDLQELQAFCHLIACVSTHKHQWVTEVGVASVRQLLVS